MNRSLLSLCCLAIVICATATEAQDIVNGLEPIGSINGFKKSETGVTFNCQDESEVRVHRPGLRPHTGAGFLQKSRCLSAIIPGQLRNRTGTPCVGI